MSGIWIRTQDKKRLVNCKDIEAVGGTVISNYDKEDYFKLGVYQTNERALEVLDEISGYIDGEHLTKFTLTVIQQKLIDGVITEEQAKELQDTLTFVYEMPKEK